MVAGGVCVVAWGGHAWLPGGVHGCGGHVWLLGGMHGCQGACMVAGGQPCVVGRGWAAVCGFWGACMVAGRACVVAGGACMVAGGWWGVHGSGGGPCIGYDEIRSMSGRYASYWNAFLFILFTLIYFLL